MDVSECSYREFLQCTINNALFEFLFVMLNQKLDFSFFESFIYNKNWCFCAFYKFKFPQWHFSMKTITENQLHDFPINSRHSCKKYCLHNSTLWGITITADPRIKFGLRKGDCFVKSCLFPEFFFGDHELFSTSFVYWSSSPKTSKSLMLEVAKVLKLTLYSVRSLKSLTPAFSQIFPVTPIFFHDFDNRY